MIFADVGVHECGIQGCDVSDEVAREVCCRGGVGTVGCDVAVDWVEAWWMEEFGIPTRLERIMSAIHSMWSSQPKVYTHRKVSCEIRATWV